ncbi:hypothetical protein CBR_g41352 [Chara braunii]|uniref:Uncharacterized protein n=1 Tax=Chara braunii TaxID=69332 RepID=A0A388LVJ9_CHABU|nr:hypothetical protein CBR_g41352 [Chara braunii]|eukprot:GBG86357.1 hypothetical protein CBR_g41352 [Chara braunii]
MANGRRTSLDRPTGVRIVELPDEASRSEVRSSVKSDEMKAWVTSTLGSSLTLITDRLEEVDKKSKLTVAEKAELEKPREEKIAFEKGEKGSKELSSNEKRKRAGQSTPAGNLPGVNRVKSQSRGGSKTKSKRIEISSDEEGANLVKQNLQAKMESSSKLADIKMMLAALMQGMNDTKGKAEEDVDVVQQEINAEEDEGDEGGLATYMKMRQDFYAYLHYTRVEEMCKQKNIQYFRKDMGVWELARLDLQEYVDMLKGGKPRSGGEPSSANGANAGESIEMNSAFGDPVKGN